MDISCSLRATTTPHIATISNYCYSDSVAFIRDRFHPRSSPSV
jgi:hypothetical protein